MTDINGHHMLFALETMGADRAFDVCTAFAQKKGQSTAGILADQLAFVVSRILPVAAQGPHSFDQNIDELIAWLKSELDTHAASAKEIACSESSSSSSSSAPSSAH